MFTLAYDTWKTRVHHDGHGNKLQACWPVQEVDREYIISHQHKSQRVNWLYKFYLQWCTSSKATSSISPPTGLPTGEQVFKELCLWQIFLFKPLYEWVATLDVWVRLANIFAGDWPHQKSQPCDNGWKNWVSECQLIRRLNSATYVIISQTSITEP